MPGVPWGVEFSKIFKNFFSGMQKCPKRFSKVSKRVLNVFWGKFFEKLFCPVFRGGSSFRKFSKKKCFQNSKNSQNVLKSIQTCFKHVAGQTFRKIFAQFSMECRVFKKFQKKYFQNSKNAQNFSQKYPNVF